MGDEINVNTEGGNIQGSIIGGKQNKINYNENVDKSRNFSVGDVGGDFNPIGSPIMSDNTKISDTNAGSTEKLNESKIKPNMGIIIAVISILITACISGLFNPEIRRFLNLDNSSENQETLEDGSI